MFGIHHSSDTGWIFPRKKKNKTTTLDLPRSPPPSWDKFFSGVFPKAARCQNHLKILKAIDEEDQSAKFFRETSHRPEQGWKCAQQFYQSYFTSACVFLFLFFFFFCTFGTFFWQCKTSHQVSERMSSNTTVKESYWKAVFTAGPPDYEWMNK